MRVHTCYRPFSRDCIRKKLTQELRKSPVNTEENQKSVENINTERYTQSEINRDLLTSRKASAKYKYRY